MAGGRDAYKRAATADNNPKQGIATRKYSPQYLKSIIAAAADVPAEAVICRKVGISRTMLRYCLKRSQEGRAGDMFDVEVKDGHAERFHILYEDAIDAGYDRHQQHANDLALGAAREVLEHHGRVVYKSDPVLLSFGLKGADAYLLDKDGSPVPETRPVGGAVQAEMTRWILTHVRPKQYGTKVQVEHEHKGGIVVVSAPRTPDQLEKTFGGGQKIVDVEFEALPPPPEKKS
jgi:hypothetical protein